MTYKKGWNLLGNSAKDFNVDIFSSKSSLIWKFKDNEWLVSSPDGAYDETINPSELTAFTTIKKGEGFWLYAKNSGSFSIEEDGNTDTKISLQKGWNLVSLKEIKTLDVSKITDDRVSAIWAYVGGK